MEDGRNGVKTADPRRSGSRIEAAVDIDRLPGEVAIACEHHGNIGNLFTAADRGNQCGNQFRGGRLVFFVVHGNVGAGVCKRIAIAHPIPRLPPLRKAIFPLISMGRLSTLVPYSFQPRSVIQILYTNRAPTA